ncbi:12691_t:CDS:10 [Entrophospora sp. SA101]|nr:12691_t:CDS:10 [Entrophospora sp. SA101]
MTLKQHSETFSEKKKIVSNYQKEQITRRLSKESVYAELKGSKSGEFITGLRNGDQVGSNNFNLDLPEPTLENLATIHSIIKIASESISLHEIALFEVLIRKDLFVKVAGIFEYDPQYTNKRPKHRKLLSDQSKHKQAVKIKDDLIKEKIHETFRIQFFRDSLLHGSCDDETLTALSSLICFNYIEICRHFANDSEYLLEIFDILNKPNEPIQKKYDSIGFLQELFHIAKNLQPSSRSDLYRALCKNGILDAIESTLEIDDPILKSGGSNLLSSIMVLEAGIVRLHILRKHRINEKSLATIIINQIVENKNSDFTTHLAGVLQSLININGSLDMDYIYEVYCHLIICLHSKIPATLTNKSLRISTSNNAISCKETRRLRTKKAGSSSNTQEEQKKKSILTIDELIKWLSKPEIKNNKKIKSKHIPKNNKEWYDLMEIDNEKDSEPSDSEYDTAEEEPDIHFEKIKDPYINRIAEARKFNEGEVCDYYAFVPKGYYAEGEPLAFFESVEEKIADVYKRELALKGGLKHETIEIIREDRINATIEKGYNKIIDQIEDEAIQESGWAFVRAEEVFLEISAFRPLRGSSWLSLPEDLDKPQLGLINPQNFKDNECFRDCVNIHHAREDALKAGQKPTHLERVSKIRRYGNIANFEGINFPATLHDVDKFEENNPNYAINIFRPVYKEVFGKIKVDIDPLHISERNYQVKHMIDLLYLTEGEENLNDRKNANDIPEGLKTHYVFITDFTRLMRKWNNHHGKKYFCRKCLRFPYSRLDLLEKHIPTCPGPSKAPQRLILPEEGKNYVKPKYFKNMLKKPYLITMDLEAEEIEVEEKDNEENTIKLAEQKAISYGYTIHCSDGTTQKPKLPQ